MRLLLTTLFCLLLSMPILKSQKLEYRLGYMIVQLEKDVNPNAIAADYAHQLRSSLSIDRTLSGPMGIYLFKFDYAKVHQGKLLDALRADRRVMVAQYDHLTQQRNIPDDPQFPSQWQWLNIGQTGGLVDGDIDADKAWDISTGGLTALGDTIVVAIVDDGLDYTHQDIAANAWINYHEIDGNGIDDDGNGYIDDIHGWNAYNDNPDVWNNQHGLNVAGMIGARGNNNTGVTGINWNVKIMMIVGGDPESAAIASYSYALTQRELYESSHGALGAFVVATNSSWGVDFGQPADAPLWCAFYDTLGVHGILSAGATANNDVDIDQVGDLPTACPSEYLLSVTALNASNQRTFSAYGITQVDFGAPGEDIYTTRRNNQYGTTSGTSFASPIAAGLIGLLYSAPCVSFAKLTHADPAAAAAYVRDVIFMGVKPIPELASTIRLGGSLNAGNSMALMVSLCSECPVPFSVSAENVTDVHATITWSLVDTVSGINARYKPVNATEWDTLENVTSPLQLTDLVGCTEYEIEFESVCTDTTTDFQSNYHFKTDGCCELPGEINISVAGTNIDMNWTSVLAAAYYVIQYRPQGTTDWIEEATAQHTYIIHDLAPCTYYEVRLQTSCDTTDTGFSDIQTVRTKGCGNCIDLNYCDNTSADASGEYIDSLIIGPLVNHSGNNGGYMLFDSFDPQYVAGNTYPVWIRPGFGAGLFDEQFRIWLDMNQDGVFDTTELLVDSVLAQANTYLISSITIADSAMTGSTRMRVSMAYANPFFPTNQDPCGQLEFGEVEDYCVDILKRPAECPGVDTLFFDGIDYTSAFMYWPAVDEAIAYTYRYREVGSSEYKDEVATVDTTANLPNLTKCTMYEVQIRTVCLFDTTSYAKNYILQTKCDVAVNDPIALLSSFMVYPNPTSDIALVRMIPVETGMHTVSIYNMQGQLLDHQAVYGDANQATTITLESVSQLPQGLYFVTVEKDGKRTTQKLIRL
jgi:serine protease